MTKDKARLAVMGAISMALEDPTLQQGFEIICKENAELERKLEQTEKDLADYQFNYPTIKELQKENAELKEQHEVSARNMSSFIESLSKSENEAKKQLTKAKDLLKRCYENYIYLEPLRSEIEQFLKE